MTYIDSPAHHALAMETDCEFFSSRSYEMIIDLKDLFIAQVRIMKYECLDKFFSIRWKRIPAWKITWQS